MGAIAAALLALAGGCQDSGEIALRLLLPEDPALSPADDRLDELTLVTTSEVDGRTVETREVVDRGAGLDLGLVPAGQSVRFAIELRSPTQRLLGYGHTAGAIEIEAGAAIEIPIHVRRPFVYLAGAESALSIFDPTLDANVDYDGSIAFATPRATAATADGTELVVVSDDGAAGALRLIATSDHVPGAAAVALAATPRDVAVSGDGAIAVVGHGGATGGVSLVELGAVRAGGGEARFVELGAVGAVAVAGGDAPRAVALLDRARGCDGATPSSLVEVGLDGGAPRTIELGAPISDLAVTAEGAVLVADPCGGRIAQVGDDGGLTTVIELPAASAVAVVGERVWGAGVAPASGPLGQRVALVARDRAAAGETRLELAPAQERIESIEFSGSEQAVEVAIDADRLAAVELAALPGTDLVALTTEAYYHSDEAGDFAGSPVVPEMEITTHEYLLVDGTSRTVVQRVRTFCDGFLLSDAVLTEFTCSTAPDQDTVPFAASFAPTQLSVLYGGR